MEKVKLVYGENHSNDFEISHAERILTRKDSGWQLPKDSPYQLIGPKLVLLKKETKKKK